MFTGLFTTLQLLFGYGKLYWTVISGVSVFVLDGEVNFKILLFELIGFPFSNVDELLLPLIAFVCVDTGEVLDLLTGLACV
jgi:hypothetical protein